MKTAPAHGSKSSVSKKNLELLRLENKQHERLVRLLNVVGSSADKLRHALDEVDRGVSVALEIRKARALIQAELARTGNTDIIKLSVARAKNEASLAALSAGNGKLIEGVEQRARENQLLICRALAIIQSVISRLNGGRSETASQSASAEKSAAA